jgi:hypothetical protein
MSTPLFTAVAMATVSLATIIPNIDVNVNKVTLFFEFSIVVL